ncbi:hypothetical protein K491DRAFT_699715 [Lophiostoma macrostomum CBS 122681]|uniref:Uncharacterized protein n=1 Tax=Lophiostoma macrostomum CBS 122681 TaxID=1314788 RepID=A0A6A6SJY9_9PLEO|nr:hypothetical protein K491DRAFT_699715 [Lophiostoma macrostomum CBS 122681]
MPPASHHSKCGASIASTEPLIHSPGQRKASRGKPSKTKSFWKKLKEENEQRKQKVQHVSHEEAERMTGYGENAVGKKDDKERTIKGSSLAALFV